MIKLHLTLKIAAFLAASLLTNNCYADTEILMILAKEAAMANSNDKQKKINVETLTELNLQSAKFSRKRAKLLLEETAKTMFSKINENHNDIVLNSRKARALFVEFLEPHINFDIIAEIVTGRNNWKTASLHEKNAFKQAYRNMLLRTYSKALSVYLGENDEKLTSDLMTFYTEENSGNSTNENRVIIYSNVQTNDNEVVKVKYYMYRTRRNPQPAWKVYNIHIDGFSVINAHRASYKRHIETSGLRSLIAEIQRKNHTQTAEVN